MSECKRLIASVPLPIARKIKSSLAGKGETMQDAIVRALCCYLELELSETERDQVNLLQHSETADRELSEAVNG